MSSPSPLSAIRESKVFKAIADISVVHWCWSVVPGIGVGIGAAMRGSPLYLIVLVGLFATALTVVIIHYWPKPKRSAPSTHHRQTAYPAVLLITAMVIVYAKYGRSEHSQNRLKWSGTGVFSENRAIEPEKALAFRFSFTPTNGYVTDTHIIAACAISSDLSGGATNWEQQVVNDFQVHVRNTMKDNSKVGPTVDNGLNAYEDMTCPAFSQVQRDQVLARTARLYALLWLGWVGQDGIKDETQFCFWLEHPEAQLTESDAGRWQNCQVSTPTQHLW